MERRNCKLKKGIDIDIEIDNIIDIAPPQMIDIDIEN